MARNTGPSGPDDENRNEPTEEGQYKRPNDERESIWSIPAKYKRWYFGLFTAQVIIAAIWLVWTAVADETLPSIPGKVMFVWQGMAPMAITSATFSLVIVDAWGTTMVIASWLEETLEKRRQRQIKAAADKGRTQGITEERQRWAEWNRRRE